jgi:hypothetical protein
LGVDQQLDPLVGHLNKIRRGLRKVEIGPDGQGVSTRVVTVGDQPFSEFFAARFEAAPQGNTYGLPVMGSNFVSQIRKRSSMAARTGIAAHAVLLRFPIML